MKVNDFDLSVLDGPDSHSYVAQYSRRVLAYAESHGAKKSLLNSIKSSINLIYNWGVEEGLITGSNLASKSPVFGLGLDTKEEKLKPILTLDEVRKFLLEAKIQKHPWYQIWAFAVLTGMRSGELMALDWGDVDEKNGIIHVSKSFYKRINTTKCPKNGTWSAYSCLTDHSFLR
jgi:integrase